MTRGNMKSFRLPFTLFIITTIFTGITFGASTQVLIKKNNNSVFKGQLIRVDQDRILILDSNKKLIKISFDSIQTIGIEKSRFLKGILLGAGIGVTIGIFTGIVINSESEAIIPGGIIIPIVSALAVISGILLAPAFPKKFKYYKFYKHSKIKKEKLLNKLRKKAKY